MSLEAATYIHELVITNPAGGDPKLQGDDHIRMIKSSLKNTFPNVAGAMNATHTELNYVIGVTSGVQAQIDSKINTTELGSAVNKIPQNNGTLNETLNADKWDGANLIVRTSNPTATVGVDGDVCLVREV